MFELIVDFVTRGGYIGVFILMALENIFPPIPSELIMPLAGFAAARGEMEVTLVVLAGTLGSITGALPWYYAGRSIGKDRLKRLAARYGRVMTVTPSDVDTALKTFKRHGHAAVFFGRLVPAVRTLISVPAGISRMPMLAFLAYSTAGSLIWTALLTAAGYLLESKYAMVSEYIDPISKIVIGLVIAMYVYRLVTYRTEPTR